MEVSKFRKLIQKHGEKNVLYIGFDNSAIRQIPNESFRLDTFCPDENIILFVEYDMAGTPYYVYKPVDDVKYVSFKKDDIPFSDYDLVGKR